MTPPPNENDPDRNFNKDSSPPSKWPKMNIIMFIVISLVGAAIAYHYYSFHMNESVQGNEGNVPSNVPRGYNKTKKVRFADEVREEEPDEETMYANAREEHLRDIRARMQGISVNETYLKNNASESESTAANARKIMGSETKASYDEDQSSFEEEQNISTSFMTKDDLDKKRSGIVQLQNELQLQHKQLVQERGAMNAGLAQSVHAYQQRYPGDNHPMVVTAAGWLK